MSWGAFIKRVDLSRMPCKVDLSLRRDIDRDVEYVHIVLHVKDMHDGSQSTVNHLIELPPYESHDDSQCLRAIRHAIRRAFEHEIDECLWLDKQQQFFPHAREARAA